MKILALATMAALGLALLTPVAAHAGDEQNLVDESRITLDHLRTDQSFGNAKEMLRKARAVLIVPNLVKAGFFLGGEGGDGVMLARSGRGTWTDPAFYTMASASFGLQIGIQAAEVVMIINTDKALTALEADQFKFGAQAGIAVVTLGAYAGLTLEGSLVKPRDSYNENYYGRPIAVREILNMNAGRNPGADNLRAALR